MDSRVRTPTVQDDSADRRTDDDVHRFPRTIKLECVEERVPFGLAPNLDIDCVPWFTDQRKANISSSTNKRSLVRRLRFILQISQLLRRVWSVR